MKVCRDQQVAAQAVDMPGAHGCRVRWLIGVADRAPNFAMRQFEVVRAATRRGTAIRMSTRCSCWTAKAWSAKATRNTRCAPETWSLSSRTKSISFAIRAQGRCVFSV